MKRLGWSHPGTRFNPCLIFKLHSECFMELVVAVDAQTLIPYFLQIKFTDEVGQNQILDIQGMKFDEAKKLLAKLTIQLKLASGL